MGMDSYNTSVSNQDKRLIEQWVYVLKYVKYQSVGSYQILKVHKRIWSVLIVEVKEVRFSKVKYP